MPLGRTPGAGYRLFRVDDRLLHGQVALAWGRQLSPRHYLLADDRLVADPEAMELYVAAAPEGTTVQVISPAALAGGAEEVADPSSTILLVRGLAEGAWLLRRGIPGPLNLGGIHAHPGARQIFPFLFLTVEEEKLVAALGSEGHMLYAQELPQSARREAAEWLRLPPEEP